MEEWSLASFIYIYIFFFLIYLAAWGLVEACRAFSCGMWDLVPEPGIEPTPPALGADSQPLDLQ